MRELKNLVERAVALASGEELKAIDFLWESTTSASITPAPLIDTQSQVTTSKIKRIHMGQTYRLIEETAKFDSALATYPRVR